MTIGRKTILLGLLLCIACNSGPTPEELASLAARGYYQHLLDGDYAHYLEGKAWADSLPADYRDQLITAYKQFMSKQQKEHRGINEVRIMNARTDTLLHETNVFLVLCFGDSTNEEIVVPMVERNGSWRMK